MHEIYMRAALQQAELALSEDEVPVGAVIVRNERIIAAAYNQREQLRDPTAHAEMIAAYLKGVRCKINVIPYNPRRDSPWPSPTERSVSAMTAALHDQGLFVRRRVTTGRRVFGACGQLGGRRDGSRGRPIAVSTGATR